MDKMYDKLNDAFSFVGVIDVNRYFEYKYDETLEGYQSLFVVGLAYENTYLKQLETKLAASMYTYGNDYHTVLKEVMKEALVEESSDDYLMLVDNHEINERKCLEMTGLAYHAKNNLMIHKDYGSYFFIGLVATKTHYPERIIENTDSCGDCDICIRACPVSALDFGFDVTKCLSAANQSKRPLTDKEIRANSLLLGCDICQRVCPKNRSIKSVVIDRFKVKDTAYVLIDDLFYLSNKQFLNKYGHHAYTWRGKTLLLRNALTILLKQKNIKYNQVIKEMIDDPKYPDWFRIDAKNIWIKLNDIEIKAH